MARPHRDFAEVMAFLAASPAEITAKWLQRAAGLEPKRAYNAITLACKRGLIERTGKPRSGRYRAKQPAGVV